MTKTLTEQQKTQVVAETNRFIKLAEDLFDKKYPVIPVLFDLKGRTVGMYKRWRGQKVIRYNAAVFAHYFDDNLANTVPHEVAHYIVDLQNRGFWKKNVRPHGKEWRLVMKAFGVDASRTANYNLENIPTKRYTRVPYVCACKPHQLGIRRHNKVVRKTVSYYCRLCGDELRAI